MAIYLSNGNKKLQPSEDTAFLIFSLPSKKTCPYATELCKKFCYASKAERVYPQVLPCREQNFEESKKATFVADMVSAITKKTTKSKKQIVVRIHESGDFYGKEYAEKWLEIARKCPSAKFMAYTKSFKYFDGVALPDNFFLRASVWADTSEEQKALIKKNNWPIYTAVDRFTEQDDFHQCRCSDCATCGKCWSKEPTICCEIH